MAKKTYVWPPQEFEFDGKKVGKIALIVVIVAFIAVGIFTSFYTVDDKQQAVVTTFGKVTSVTDPGLHFKIPFGVQQARNVDVNVYQKIELGYTTDDAGNTTTIPKESTMITGDYNIVNVDFFVEYRITDPVKYLYSSVDPELILRNLIQSQVRNVVGSSTVDSVLTDGKENIQMQVRELVTKILGEYDIGLTLVDVRIQDAEPPTVDVVEAFKGVETAKQQAEAVVNDAVAYKNAQLPNAAAEADKLLQNAQYLKQKRINEAVEQVAMFNAMYAEYALNPDVTKARMYFEAISEILPGVKIYINTTGADGSEVQMLLPLESIVQNNNQVVGGSAQ